MKKTSFVLLAALLIKGAVFAAADPVFLKMIVIDEDRFALRFSGPVEPDITMRARPPRLIINLPEVNYGSVGQVLPGKGKVFKRIRTAMVSGETEDLRLVVDLAKAGPFSQDWKSDNTLDTPAQGRRLMRTMDCCPIAESSLTMTSAWARLR